MKNILRRMRGALGNAFVWATGWFAAGWVIVTGVYLFDSRTFWSLFLSNALSYSLTMAVVGFVTGGAFSAYIAAAFNERRVEGLSPVRFALGGSLVAVLVGLLAMSTIAATSGIGLPLLDMLIVPSVISAGLGALTGYGTLKLAQHAMLESGGARGELESPAGGLLDEG